MNRRHFLDTLGAGSLLALAPTAVRAAALKRVVVVGGGMAGATAAKYLRLWSNKTVDVTLVDTSTKYVSNIMSNLVVTGQYAPTILDYGWSNLVKNHGVKLLNGTVTQVESGGSLGTWKVTVTKGSTVTVLYAERVVLAPGVKFDAVPSTDNAALAAPVLHAWEAGTQTTQLRDYLAAMPSSGTFVLTIPKAPYRCPPGPYERACLIADWLKAKKPGSKLIVLDANPGIVTEVDNFTNAFMGLHGNVIEYHANAEVTSVDPASMSLFTTAGTIRGDVINMIPRQRAGSLVATAGLNNATEGRFAGVNVLSYASTVSGASKVHIIGDSSATTQPKAGHIANQEAKVCADAISRILSGGSPDPAPVTNSACFSTITMTQASWLTAVFQYNPATLAMAPVAASSGASTGWNSDNFQDMGKWFSTLMGDSFA